MSKPNLTAWALLVVSDPGQAETLPHQEAWAKTIAAEKGWTITKTFSGVSSGKMGTRDLTTRMLNDLEMTPAEQRPARVLMIRIERLGRGDGIEAIATFLRIRQLGVLIHTRQDGDITYGRASNLFPPLFKMMVGGLENENRKDKLCALYKRLRTAHQDDPTVAISMKPPYGLAYVKGHLVPKPPEDAAVRLAYAMKGEGYGCHLIGKRLAVVAPPMTLKNGEARPQHWTGDRVHRLLAKTSYRGILVDEVTWARAQQPAREVSRPTVRHEYPLGGALRCACGRALAGSTGSRASGVRARYYQCRHMRNHDGHMKHYPSAHIEYQFEDLLGRLTADNALLENYANTRRDRDEVETLDQRLDSMRRELARIDDRRRVVFEALEDATLPREQLRWRLDDLSRLETELGSQIVSAEQERELARTRRVHLDDLRRVVDSARRCWPDAQIDDRRALAKAVANAFGGLVVDFDGTLRIGALISNGRASQRTLGSAPGGSPAVITAPASAPF